MGKDQTTASDHKSTNALDDVEPNEQAGLSVDAYLSFGTAPRAVVNPPHQDDIVEYKVTVECVGARKKRMKDGEMRYTRDLEILKVARINDEYPPDANEKQPEMFDGEGNPTTEAGGEPESVGDVIKGAFGDGVTVTDDAADDSDSEAE
jgi:hypothetical protein